MTKQLITVKEIIFLSIVMLLLVALDLTILPARLLGEIKILDVEPIYFSLIFNQWLLIVLALITIKQISPNFSLGLKKEGLKKGLKTYLPSGVLFLVVAGFAYFIGLVGKLDYRPTFFKVFTETFFYNISVGFLEEIYIRGLLLNILIWLFRKKENGTFIAIVLSSVLFSLGHIPGMIEDDIFIIIMRLIWTLMLGFYLGIMYKKTDNLWVPIIIHAILNFSGIAFCFTTNKEFPLISVIIIAAFSVILGIASIYSYFSKKDKGVLLIESLNE